MEYVDPHDDPRAHPA